MSCGPEASALLGKSLEKNGARRATCKKMEPLTSSLNAWTLQRLGVLVAGLAHRGFSPTPSHRVASGWCWRRGGAPGGGRAEQGRAASPQPAIQLSAAVHGWLDQEKERPEEQSRWPPACTELFERCHAWLAGWLVQEEDRLAEVDSGAESEAEKTAVRAKKEKKGLGKAGKAKAAGKVRAPVV
jgi:hypothetical protein